MLALGLTAALCWGVSDFLAGRQARSMPTLVVLAGSQLVALVAYGAATLVLDAGSGTPGDVLVTASLAGVFGVVGLGCFYRALAIGRMSIVAPVVATGTVVPVLAGVVGGDSLAALSAVGIALAIVGVVLASRATAEQGDGEPRSAGMSAVLLAIAAAGSIGLALVLLDTAAEDSVLWTLVVARLVSTALAVAALVVMRPQLSLSARGLLPIVAVGALEALANGLFTLATTLGALSLTAVAASLYPVVTVLLARTMLNERLSREQVAGVLTALVGVALMAAR